MDEEIKAVSGEGYIDIALDTIAQKRQTLIFNNSKRSAEKAAEELSKHISVQEKKWEEISTELLRVLPSPTKQCRRLAQCARKGVVFHHSGLASKQREIIEEEFRKGNLSIISSTPTLCLSKDTKIWHQDKETKVSELKVSQPLFVLSQNAITLMKAQRVERLRNNSKLIEMSSICGYAIKVTPNHKMLIKRGNEKVVAKAENIRKGDKIATIGRLLLAKNREPCVGEFCRENESPSKSLKFDSELSYFIGIFLGDGYSGAETRGKNILYKGSPTIVGKDGEIFAHTEDICRKIGIHCRARTMPSGVESRILGKNKWFRELLVRSGIEKGLHKHISQKLMTMNLDNTSALLQGLFDTDGWVEKSARIGFSSISEKLVRQIQKLLLRFSIISRIRKRKAGVMQIYEAQYITQPSYEVAIFNKKSIQNFHTNIGFRIKRKQTALARIVDKIGSNHNYLSCNKCNYKIYRDLFSGRNRDQKKWGQTKHTVIQLLGRNGELGSKDLQRRLHEMPRKNELRLNHHYELIQKRRIGSLSKTEWFWCLNDIGKWFYNNALSTEGFEAFFTREYCPLCGKILNKVIKKGWKDSNFEGDIYWDIVKSVKETEVENEVYDVVLPHRPKNDHFFVAEGFIVHNSLGLDLPAFRAIIRDLKRFDDGGMREIPVMEYHQICGRAGRPGKESEGQAIVLCSSEKQATHVIKKYIYGKPEEILSKLAVEPVLRMYLLSLVATEFISNKRDMLSFFEKTFWAHQYKDMAEIALILEHLVDLLAEWKFIETDKHTQEKGEETMRRGKSSATSRTVVSGDFVSASFALRENYNYYLRATRLGKRIAELYLDPLSAHELIQHLLHAESAHLGWFAYLYALVSTSEMRPYLSIVKNDYEQLDVRADLRKNEIPETVPEAWNEEYEEFLQKFKTCLLLESWMDERSEEWLLEQYNARPGDLQYKLQNAEWIIHCAQELARMHELRESMRVLNELSLRMKYGVKKELLSLLRLKGIGRVRARTLYASKICDLGEVKRADSMMLARLLGPEIAKSIKKQVGIIVTEQSEEDSEENSNGNQKNTDKKEKRKGQQLLGDY